MPENIVSTRYQVLGIRSNDDVTAALQSLYDVFADIGLGQATFEMTGEQAADLVVKHQKSVVPDSAEIDAALRRAGNFRLVVG